MPSPFKTQATPYPDGITEESAFFALDGPPAQSLADLERIAKACNDWGTPEAQALAWEAEEYSRGLANV